MSVCPPIGLPGLDPAASIRTLIDVQAGDGQRAPSKLGLALLVLRWQFAFNVAEIAEEIWVTLVPQISAPNFLGSNLCSIRSNP